MAFLRLKKTDTVYIYAKMYVVGKFLDFHTVQDWEYYWTEVIEDNDQITAALNEAANPNPANDVLHGMEASVQCHLGFVLAKWSFREAWPCTFGSNYDYLM